MSVGALAGPVVASRGSLPKFISTFDPTRLTMRSLGVQMAQRYHPSFYVVQFRSFSTNPVQPDMSSIQTVSVLEPSSTSTSKKVAFSSVALTQVFSSITDHAKKAPLKLDSKGNPFVGQKGFLIDPEKLPRVIRFNPPHAGDDVVDFDTRLTQDILKNGIPWTQFVMTTLDSDSSMGGMSRRYTNEGSLFIGLSSDHHRYLIKRLPSPFAEREAVLFWLLSLVKQEEHAIPSFLSVEPDRQLYVVRGFCRGTPISLDNLKESAHISDQTILRMFLLKFLFQDSDINNPNNSMDSNLVDTHGLSALTKKSAVIIDAERFLTDQASMTILAAKYGWSWKSGDPIPGTHQFRAAAYKKMGEEAFIRNEIEHNPHVRLLWLRYTQKHPDDYTGFVKRLKAYDYVSNDPANQVILSTLIELHEKGGFKLFLVQMGIIKKGDDAAYDQCVENIKFAQNCLKKHGKLTVFQIVTGQID